MDSPARLAQLPLHATPELVENLEQRALPDDFEVYKRDDLVGFLNRIKAGDYDNIHVCPDAYTQIVDPDTGDSVLQIAIRHGSLDGVTNILEQFQRCRGPFYQWARHALFAHRNKAGNNCLHEAAKRGILDLLIMVYRAIDDHVSWVFPSERDIPGAPEKRVYHISTEDESSSAHLLMLLTQNSQGRTPAAEARAAGNGTLAQLLEDIVEKLDPKGVRRSEAGMAQMLEIVQYVYWYDVVELSDGTRLIPNIFVNGQLLGLEGYGLGYLKFPTVLRDVVSSDKSVSIAAPASYWYLKRFPIERIARVIDSSYLVYMTYDLHGQWDYGNVNAFDACPSGKCIRSRVTKVGEPNNKVFVGESSYGRSFRMAQDGCWQPMCEFTGSRTQSNANPGRCTQTGGYISDPEINEILARGNGA
ncbi:hypothetical protein CDD83_10286 [Cordyceps sp. RAO-2017]|nr:hypothetical protein CDD83_10286 [Cordyceps sp. RAO-2017]